MRLFPLALLVPVAICDDGAAKGCADHDTCDIDKVDLMQSKGASRSSTSKTSHDSPIRHETIRVPGVGKLMCSKLHSGITECLNIPFAKPPIKELRFLPPQPLAGKLGDIDATQKGPWCWQTQCIDGRFCSEDCLQLNVWVPRSRDGYAHQRKKYPVFFWIHGGGFSMGSSDMYNASHYAEQGVVAVVINYRIGALGFLNLPQIAEVADGPDGGLNGILDQVMALRWVNDHIGSFGGDKHQITIAGESAGALSISAIMKLDLSKGLFQRAILESGGWRHPWQYLTFNQSNMGYPTRSQWVSAFLFENGVPSGNLDQLQAIPAEELVQKNMWGTPPFPDGFYMKAPPWELPLNDGIRDVMIGTTSMDTLLAPPYVTEEQLSFLLGLPNPDVFNAILGQLLGPEALKFYPVTSETTPEAVFRYWYLAQTDVCNICPTYWEAADVLDKNINLYLYHFSYNRDPKYRGLTPHGFELPSVFNTTEELFPGIPVELVPTYTPKLGGHILSYWASFVKTGRPSSRIEWPKYSEQKTRMLKVLTDNFSQPDVVQGLGPSKDQCAYFHRYIHQSEDQHRKYNGFCNGGISPPSGVSHASDARGLLRDELPSLWG